MISEIGSLSNLPTSYWGLACIVAVGVGSAFYWVEKIYASDSSKESLALWLMGAEESTWAQQFCNRFDFVFGKKHRSWSCFFRSSIASILTVAFLYILLGPILGVVSVRAEDGLPLWMVLVLGAMVNIVPDYFSLWETRWLLQVFGSVRSFWGQILVLIGDAIVTGLIIYLSINLFRMLTGNAPLSIFEMVLMFSIYALFFYSTFVTSVWAWLYCLSTWLMRLFSRTFLKDRLDVEHKPLAQIGLVAGVVAFFFTAAAGAVLSPAHETEDGSKITTLDLLVCSRISAEVCKHIVRLSPQDRQDLEILTRACEGGDTKLCMDSAFRHFDGDKAKAARLWQKACDGGIMAGCGALGYMYDNGDGVEQKLAKAVSLYRQACGGEEIIGCNNLGLMYKTGKGVEQDFAKAISLFRRACEGGDMKSCANLGRMHETGKGVEQNFVKAASLYRQACEDGEMGGCTNLGHMHETGNGVEQNFVKAASLYRQACEDGDMMGCNNLGAMYYTDKGVEQDLAKAVSLFRQACNKDVQEACVNLFDMRISGVDGKQDHSKTVTFYQQACNGGDMASCTGLGVFYQHGKGVDQDITKAALLFRKACDGGIDPACDLLNDLPAH